MRNLKVQFPLAGTRTMLLRTTLDPESCEHEGRLSGECEGNYSYSPTRVALNLHAMRLCTGMFIRRRVLRVGVVDVVMFLDIFLRVCILFIFSKSTENAPVYSTHVHVGFFLYVRPLALPVYTYEARRSDGATR